MKNKVGTFLIIGSIASLAISFGLQYHRFDDVEKQISLMRDRKYFSVIFAEDLMKTSQETIRLARLYVATLDPEYKRMFGRIIDTREGRLPLYEQRDLSLLAILRYREECPHPFDERASFMAMASMAGFESFELSLLDKAKKSSDALNARAVHAMEQADLHQDSMDQRMESMKLLINRDFLESSNNIMSLIKRFQIAANERYSGEISRMEKQAEHSRNLLLAMGLALSSLVVGGLIVEVMRAERYRKNSFTDTLTRLHTRGRLHEYLKQTTGRAEARGEIVILAFIDLDGFKQVNDKFGHKVGDQLLVTVADCLRAQCRDIDFVARYGGDEFVVSFASPMNHRSQSIDRMKKIIMGSFQEIQREPFGSQIGASAGISIFPCPCPTVDSLIKCADEAMYAAKRHGTKVSIQVHEMDNALAC